MGTYTNVKNIFPPKENILYQSLHRMKEVCGATSCIMKDELIVGEHQVDGNWLLIYIYIYLYIDVFFLLQYLCHK